MIRLALAAWLALTAAEVAVLTTTKNDLSNSTTTTIDPWSPLLGDTEGAPTVTEPSPGRRRGEQNLVESIRLQLMHDNYDYVGKGSAESTQQPQRTRAPVPNRVVHRQMASARKDNKAFEEEIQAYTPSPQYKALIDEQLALRQASRRSSTDYTVTVTEKDLLYYLDDNYLRYKYLVSEIPFGRRSFNNTFFVNSEGHQTQANIKHTDKQNKNKKHDGRRQSFADVSNMKNDRKQTTQQTVATNNTRKVAVNDQRDELISEESNENKNISNNNEYSNEFFWDGNSNVSEKSQQPVNRRMYYKRPPNDEIENKRRYRKKKLKQFSRFSHKNQALRNAVLRNKANYRRNKMYSEQKKMLQDGQKYFQQLKKYRQQRQKTRKHISQVTPYQLKTKMRHGNNILHQRQQQDSGRNGLQQRRRRYQKDYRGHVRSDLIPEATDDEEENVSQNNSPNNNEMPNDKQEDKQDNTQQEELNGSLTEEDDYKDGQQNEQQMNQIQTNMDKDDDETDGSWKQKDKKRYVVSNSLEHDIRTGKLIIGNRRMDIPLNDTQVELQNDKYEDGLNETQYEDIEDGDETKLKDALTYTPIKENTTSTPTAKYKLIKVKSGGSRRSHKGERQFLQERRADGGVSLIALDGGPFPQFRLPLSRRQYMFESHHKHDPLKDQLPKAARLTHNHLNQ